MQVTIATILSALSLSTMASPFPVESRRSEDVNEQLETSATTCVPAVFFAARGSDPQQTTLDYNPRYSDLPTPMLNTANEIIGQNGGDPATGLQPLNYPAIDPSGNYLASVAQGAGTLQQNIRDYVAACPDGKIFLSGYSQGAQVVSTALGGNSNGIAPLEGVAAGRVTGVTLFADPTTLDGLTNINGGSGASNGPSGVLAGDGNTQRYLNDNFVNRLHTYCTAGDQFCDSGSGADAGSIHIGAPADFEDEASAFLTGL